MANLLTNVAQACEDLTNIKTAIIDKGVAIDAGTPSSDYAGKVGEVYEAGKKAEYDAFWDAYQDNGNRLDYVGAFEGKGWNDKTFKPKYDIHPNHQITRMFHWCYITDLEAILKDCGVGFDVSGGLNYGSLFSYSTITVIPEVWINKSATTIYEMFAYNPYLHTIRKLTFEEGVTAIATTVFTNCTSLANIVFDGVIANYIDMQWCPLTKASITSLFNVLSDSVSEKTVTLNKAAKEAAFTDDEWEALIATKSNWTISLV